MKKKVRRVPYVMVIEIPFKAGDEVGKSQLGQTTLVDDKPFVVESVTLGGRPSGLVEVRMIVNSGTDADKIKWQQAPFPASWVRRFWSRMRARLDPGTILEAKFTLRETPRADVVVDVAFSGHRLVPVAALVPRAATKKVAPRSEPPIQRPA